ncbi:two-component sensor histidine kinase [Pleomorphomonas diazotrophica]|uniref:histidine kinase n=1 Tax=Pleomorphomonas diazotrophica TaxID=1166257 RepID=A0A1I4SWH3_9HYPH|nr:ATP-binding protein [Pleomorphomonas diazotrophica]PKR88584.1 two-component sensor histidine kinase [Pleomorphomonas diazotrophica]SFM68802.1 two-component system, OmpR family, phosphate regulon sensor histidine kinase PhoR [Pleomorphomonas diazotrophica]
MSSTPDRPEDTPREGRGRLAEAITEGRLQTVLAAAAAFWLIMLFIADLPTAVALMGFVATAIAAVSVLPTGGKTAQPRPADRLPARRWPDTGMKLLLDGMEEPAFLTDADGTLRYQNAAAAAEFGSARIGDPLAFRLRAPEILDALQRAGRGETLPPVRFIERGIGGERHFVVRCSPLRLPRPEPRKRPDFVLLRLRDESEAVRLDRMRSDFVANASHELRTPLASLTGFIETLLGPARRDEANRERFLTIMLEQARRMGRLIDDLMSLSRLEMKAHVRPTGAVDLAEVLPAVADMLAPVAADRHAVVIAENTLAAAPTAGDRDELTQVFANLVENAVKYGRDGGRITLEIREEIGDDGRAGFRASVSDDGPGIAAEHLPRLTERFYRVDAARSREQRGTGLGLAIVKHIVNRHQGRLVIRSEVGVGTTVNVWLPRRSDLVEAEMTKETKLVTDERLEA